MGKQYETKTIGGFYIDVKEKNQKVCCNVYLKDKLIRTGKGIKDFDSVFVESFDSLEKAQSYCRAYQGIFDNNSDFEWMYSSYRFMPGTLVKVPEKLGLLKNLLDNNIIFNKDLQLILYMLIANMYNNIVECAEKLEEEFATECDKLDYYFVKTLIKDKIVGKDFYMQVAIRCIYTANLFTDCDKTHYSLNLVEKRKRVKSKIDWAVDRFLYVTKNELERYKEIVSRLNSIYGFDIPMIKQLGYLKIKE